MIEAFLFDLDGVIIDSEKYNLFYKRELLKMLGYNLSDDVIIKSFGLGKKEASDYYYEITGNYEIYEDLREYRRTMMKKIIKKNGLPLKEGANDVLDYLKTKGYKLGLVTSSEKSLLEFYMQFSDIFKYFDVIVTNDLVKRGKPHPDPYQMALKILGVEAQNGLAIEDSYNGILSAKGANLRSVYCKDIVKLNCKEIQKADFLINSLKELKDIEKEIKNENSKKDI